MKQTLYCAFIKPGKAREQNQVVFIIFCGFQDLPLEYRTPVFRPVKFHLDINDSQWNIPSQNIFGHKTFGYKVLGLLEICIIKNPDQLYTTCLHTV